jgi:hypothetical protein
VAQESLPDLIEEIQPSVVTVYAHDRYGTIISQGTGFFVSAAGDVVTNFHVLDEASSASIVLASGKEMPVVSVVASHEALDIIVVRVDPGDQRITSLRSARQLPRVGERVIAIGSPLGLELSVSDGIVAAVRKRSDATVIQITAPISPGSSGSPVINSQGAVIGVATFRLAGGQSLNFAIPLTGLELRNATPLAFDAWYDLRIRRAEADSLYREAERTRIRYSSCLGAFRDLWRVVNTWPDHVAAWTRLGECHAEVELWPAAIEAFNEALQREPDHANARFGLGMAYAESGETDKAREQHGLLSGINAELAHRLLGLIDRGR